MSSAKIEQEEDIYPASDGKPMAETPDHVVLMVMLLSALRCFFRNCRDVYVIGNVFLYYKKGDITARRAPDIMVVKGVDPAIPRRSFKTWVEGTVPRVVFELTSNKTADEDLEIKLPLYEKLGIQEYFLFDPLNDYLPQQLMGFRLVKKRFVPMTPDEDDSMISEELGLRLVPHGKELHLIDIKTGERLLAREELSDLLKEMKHQAGEAVEEFSQMEKAFQAAKQRAERASKLAAKEKLRAQRAEQEKQQEKQRAERAEQEKQQEKQRAEQEKQRAEQEKQRAEQEKQRADQEKQRADTLAAEIARLRAQQRGSNEPRQN